jgi:hypothetical protein
VDEEKSLEDSNRFEELLNQIDQVRGVTVSEGSSVGQEADVDLSQNEPNLFSEDQDDVEYNDRPPGDDITSEFSKTVSGNSMMLLNNYIKLLFIQSNLY